jgi:hypothetical protein
LSTNSKFIANNGTSEKFFENGGDTGIRSRNAVKIAAESEGKFFLMKITCGTHLPGAVGWGGHAVLGPLRAANE